LINQNIQSGISETGVFAYVVTMAKYIIESKIAIISKIINSFIISSLSEMIHVKHYNKKGGFIGSRQPLTF